MGSDCWGAEQRLWQMMQLHWWIIWAGKKLMFLDTPWVSLWPWIFMFRFSSTRFLIGQVTKYSLNWNVALLGQENQGTIGGVLAVIFKRKCSILMKFQESLGWNIEIQLYDSLNGCLLLIKEGSIKNPEMVDFHNALVSWSRFTVQETIFFDWYWIKSILSFFLFTIKTGAMIACKLAAMVPERILSLALLNVTGGGFECFPKVFYISQHHSSWLSLFPFWTVEYWCYVYHMSTTSLFLSNYI